MTYVIKWPDKDGMYAKFDYSDNWKAVPVSREQATLFGDLDSAVLQALIVDSKDPIRDWRGTVQEYVQ